MTKAVIFDMDGLLIDSEPLWKEAELEAFQEVGVPLTLAMTDETTGLRVDEVVAHWHRRYPWTEPSGEDVADKLVARVIKLIDKSGAPMAGVDRAFEIISRAGLPMAIASSSAQVIIDAVLDRIGGKHHMRVIHSAEHEPYGKPHPGVYLTAAKKLGVSPTDCLALEDSVNGVLAAKAARMKCVAVPEAHLRQDPRFGIADLVIDSLEDFTSGMLK